MFQRLQLPVVELAVVQRTEHWSCSISFNKSQKANNNIPPMQKRTPHNDPLIQLHQKINTTHDHGFIELGSLLAEWSWPFSQCAWMLVKLVVSTIIWSTWKRMSHHSTIIVGVVGSTTTFHNRLKNFFFYQNSYLFQRF